MQTPIKITILSVICVFLFSCNESPHVDFHSYQELSLYGFFDKEWLPEILGADLTHVQQTYDVNNKHLFGEFEFTDRERYDSIVETYDKVEIDTLINRMEQINKPIAPDWFISKRDLVKGNYIFVKHQEFYLILEKEANRIYYMR